MLDLLTARQLIKDKENAYSQTSSSNKYEITHIQKFEINMQNQIINKQSNITNYISYDKKILLGNSLHSQLIYLLNSLEQINNKFIGKYIKDITIELNSDKEVINIKNELYDFAIRYCKQRANKHNNKDKKFIIDKLLRITMELIPSITEMLYIENSLFTYLLKDIYLYIGLKLESCVKTVECKRINMKKNKYQLSIFRFSSSSSIIDLFRKIEYFDVENNNISNKDMIGECKLMIEEIIKYKHYIPNKPEEIDIFNNKDYVKCNWEYKNNNILIIPELNISINHDGIIVDSNYGFLNMNTFYEVIEEDTCYKFNHFILTNIFNYFENIMKTININEIENNIVLENKQTVIDNNINNDIQTKPTVKNTLKQYNIKKNTTWNKFLKLIKENFNVVVEQGKGDDIKIYIKNIKDNNAKIYRTADMSKREILIKTQENILKKIGISIKMWNLNKYNIENNI